MVSVTFLSEPPRAEISITSFLESFVDTCFSGSTVICSKETLHSYLVDKVVSKYWWSLTKEQRISLGDFIITNFGSFVITSVGEGDTDCKGGVTNWTKAVCLHRALIYLCKLNSHDIFHDLSECYYKDSEGKVHCYTEGNYGLPCYATIITGVGWGWGHASYTLQVGAGIAEFDSWLNIHSSPWNINIEVQELPSVGCSSWYGNTIASWYIDEEGVIHKGAKK